MSLHYAQKHVEGLISKSWPTAVGRITKSTMESNIGRKGSMSYEVKVAYEYSAAGRTFTGSRIHPTYVADWHYDSHMALRNRLRPKSIVQVSYHAGDPSQSYLATGFLTAGLLPLLGGLMFLGAGIAFGTMMLLINYGNHDYASLILKP